MRGTDIINKAKSEIKDFVVFEVKTLYRLINGEEPNFNEDEEYCLDLNGVTISVVVDSSYLDIEDVIIEHWEVNEVIVTLDDNLFFRMDNGNDDELEWTDVDITELAGIANILEHQYKKLVNKK